MTSKSVSVQDPGPGPAGVGQAGHPGSRPTLHGRLVWKCNAPAGCGGRWASRGA